MVKDMKLYITKVEQESPPTEDRASDHPVPRVTGGVVLVTAESDLGVLQFSAAISERVAVGDEVHVRVDYAPVSI